MKDYSPRCLMAEKLSRQTGHCRIGDGGLLGITAWELLEQLLERLEEEEEEEVVADTRECHGALPPIHILDVVITLSPPLALLPLTDSPVLILAVFLTAPGPPLRPLAVRTGASGTGGAVVGELVRSMVGT